MMRRTTLVSSLVSSAMLFGILAAAAYGATYTPHLLLTPPGAFTYTDSFASSVVPGLQGGNAATSGNDHAIRWDSATADYVDLNAAGNAYSFLNAISPSNQVGVIGSTPTDAGHAAVWTGNAASEFPLPELTFSSSAATGISGNNIVGFGELGGNDHAVLWTGSGVSYTAADIHPTNLIYTSSFARATDGVTITGAASEGSLQLGAMWKVSSPTTTFSLLAGPWITSIGWSVSGDQIVGSGDTGSGPHAILWTNDGSTVTDLQGTDPSFVSSFAFGTNGINQVGSITDSDGDLLPYIWSGTAASAAPLLLPAGYVSGEAEGIDSAGDIVGYGIDGGGHTQAILWTASAVPEPTTLVLLAPLAAATVLRKRRRA